jgi:hypothetical protein
VRQDRDCSTLEPSTCAAKYDPDEVCEETATSCTFYKLLNSESCSSYCQERGGTCIDAFADARGGCARLHDSHCDDPVSDNICVCSIANTPVVNPANGHEYYLLGISSWTDAEEQAIALGGHLVTIDNQAENDWVLQTFSSYIPVQPCTGLWIGLTDSNGEVLWVSGDAVTYTNWNDGEPNSQSEDYANMLVQGRPSDGYWNDLPNSGYGCIYGVAEVIPQ